LFRFEYSFYPNWQEKGQYLWESCEHIILDDDWPVRDQFLSLISKLRVEVDEEVDGVEGDGEETHGGGGVQSREDHFEGGLPDDDPEE
jgi:hypothetical protein